MTPAATRGPTTGTSTLARLTIARVPADTLSATMNYAPASNVNLHVDQAAEMGFEDEYELARAAILKATGQEVTA